jgi:hypothetical protein
MAGTINKKLIDKEIFNSRAVKKMVRDMVKAEVEKEKALFRSEFESHPVTQEIEGGESASNISGTLGGYGNLFSFLGFNRSANPTTPVKILIKKILLDRKVQSTKNGFKINVNVPSKDEFGAVARLPWEGGRSWLLDMERGISGLGSFLYGRFEASRSGGGIQSKYKYSNRVFRPVKYFSQMYVKFLKRLASIK